MYRKKKNTNLCQAGTSCPSQEFISQVIRDFAYFVFVYKIDFFYRNICTGPFISCDSEGE